mmetsp:Transcript_118065/g.252224  ORF Transcript_118065/g.252224 Transcript_118065/m.252224 type:complete len:221 (+) Transcript_118065:315-977(+)
MASARGVEEMKEALRLGQVQVDDLEVRLHEWTLQLALEFLERNPPRAVCIAPFEELFDLVDELSVLRIADTVEGEVEEDTCDEAQHHQGCEGDVDREQHCHSRRNVLHERVHHVLPIHAAHDRLEEREDRYTERAPVFLERRVLCKLRGLLVVMLNDDLHKVDRQDVDHEYEEKQHPQEGAQCTTDGTSHRSKLPNEMQNADHSHDSEKPHDPHDPEQQG